MLSIAPAIHLGAQCGPKIELATVKFGPYPGYGGPFSSVNGKVSLYSDGDGVQAATHAVARPAARCNCR